jgi:branched-chain amino acid transport system ATP-binding protein
MLELRDVDVSLAGSRILHKVSLDVAPGELVCVVGRNGAGKTTLFRTLMGYYRASVGSIKWAHESIAGKQTYEIVRAGIAFSPEESEIFAELSVAQNLSFGTWTRRTERESSERIGFALSVFPKLKEYLHRGGAQLSGGERKMVSIGRALALDPDLLVLDEPFEGLSPAIIPTIAAGVARIRQSGRAILMAESNVQHIPDCATRLYVLERGEIVFTGTPDEARAEPSLKNVLSGFA